MPIVPALLLALAVLLPFWRVVGGWDVVFLSDALRQHWPFQAVLGRVLAADPAGLPAWDPWLLAGHPLLADPQFQVFYPPALLYRFLPFPAAFGLFLGLHLLVAAFGTATLLRRRGLPPYAAVVGALAFALGAHPAQLLAVPPVLCAYAWLPWVAVAADRLAERPGVASAAALAATFGWLALTGYPPYLAYAGLAAAVVMLFPRGARRAGALRWGAAGLGLGLAVAAAMLVPFAAYLPDTTRAAAMTPEAAAAGALPLWNLAGWLVPEAYLPGGGPDPVLGAPHLWTSLHYIGTLPLAMAVAGWVLGRRDAALRAPAVLAGGGLLLALLPWLLALTPASVALAWLTARTPLGWLRHQGLWAGAAGLGLAWLAAAGARVVRDRLQAPEGRRLVRGWAVALVFAAAFIAGSKILALGRFKAELAADPDSLAVFVAQRAGLAATPAIWLGIGWVLVWLASRREIHASVAAIGLAVVAWFDLMGVAARVQPTAKRAWVMAASPTEDALRAASSRDGWERVHVTPRLEQWGSDPGEGVEGVTRNLRAAERYNLPAVAGFRQAGGNDPLRPRGTDRALDGISLAPTRPWDEKARRVFDRLGVRWLITRGAIDGPGLRKVHAGHVTIYERDRAMTGPAWIPGAGTGRVLSADHTKPGVWVIEVDVRKSANLIVSESWVKGWRARNGGAVESTEDGLLSVPVEPGRKTVTLTYTAPGAWIGLGLSLVVLAGLLWAGARPFLAGPR